MIGNPTPHNCSVSTGRAAVNDTQVRRTARRCPAFCSRGSEKHSGNARINKSCINGFIWRGCRFQCFCSRTAIDLRAVKTTSARSFGIVSMNNRSPAPGTGEKVGWSISFRFRLLSLCRSRPSISNYQPPRGRRTTNRRPSHGSILCPDCKPRARTLR
jgi:hypothetical protein